MGPTPGELLLLIVVVLVVVLVRTSRSRATTSRDALVGPERGTHFEALDEGAGPSWPQSAYTPDECSQALRDVVVTEHRGRTLLSGVLETAYAEDGARVGLDAGARRRITAVQLPEVGGSCRVGTSWTTALPGHSRVRRPSTVRSEEPTVLTGAPWHSSEQASAQLQSEGDPDLVRALLHLAVLTTVEPQVGEPLLMAVEEGWLVVVSREPGRRPVANLLALARVASDHLDAPFQPR